MTRESPENSDTDHQTGLEGLTERHPEDQAKNQHHDRQDNHGSDVKNALYN